MGPLLRLLLLAVLLLQATAPARAGEGESDWAAYRDLYRQMIWFEKYGKPKHFLQNLLRLRPRDKNVAMDGLRLTLRSKNGDLNLPLDGLGQAVFPFSKAAFDDNAELVFNRKAGQLEATSWVSIVSRPDGVYEAADLRAACDQLLAYLRYSGESWAGGKRCVGVQFAYGRSDAQAEVRFRKPDRGQLPLPTREGAAFPGDVVPNFHLFIYRFATLPEQGQLVTRDTPLAIAPLFE